MNLVSVIIPYYYKKKYITRTLKSVINQTYKNIEVILIFDEGKKKNLNFIKKLSKIDKRISILVNKKNLGAGMSRNQGIKKAKGKYLAFIDSDDIWKKNKIRSQINFLEKKKFDICHTSYQISKNEKIISFRKARNFNNYKDLIKSCDIGLSTALLKKKIIGKKFMFSNLKTKEDFVFWLKLLKSGYKIGGLNKKLVIWRKTENSLSSSSFQKIKDGFKVYNFYMKFGILKSLYYLACLSFNYIIKNNDY